MTNANLYDFSDTSDLAPEMAKRLETKSAGGTPEWATALYAVVAGAPIALSIAQVMAVAARAAIEVPAETTVRTWLNRGVDAGSISKPTRQTYAGPDAAGEEEPVEDAVETDDDILAGLDA